MPAPDGLQKRGAALWLALGKDLDSSAGAVALEACRTVDRLDELDQIIAGKGVLNLLMFRTKLDLEDLVGDTLTIKIEISNVLSEARQQGAALKQLLTTLGIAPAKAPSGEEESPLAQVLKLVANAKPSSGPAE